jgi:hypothetical protein
MDYKEIIELVDKLQWEIYDTTNEEQYLFITVSFSNGNCLIEFLGLLIWYSDDDMREYDDDLDEYEPLEGYLRREINKEMEKLSKIKL